MCLSRSTFSISPSTTHTHSYASESPESRTSASTEAQVRTACLRQACCPQPLTYRRGPPLFGTKMHEKRHELTSRAPSLHRVVFLTSYTRVHDRSRTRAVRMGNHTRRDYCVPHIVVRAPFRRGPLPQKVVPIPCASVEDPDLLVVTFSFRS